MNPEYVEPFNSRNQEIGGANTTNRRGAARQALAFRPVSRHCQALAVCPVSRRRQALAFRPVYRHRQALAVCPVSRHRQALAFRPVSRHCQALAVCPVSRRRQALAFRPVSRHRQALAVCPVSRRAAPRRFFSHFHEWPPLRSRAQKEHQRRSPKAASFARHRKRWHTK